MKLVSEKFNCAIAKALGMENIDLDFDLIKNKSMDSLAIMSFIAIIDINFGVMLKGHDLQKCSTVKDIYFLIEERLSQREIA